MESFAQVLRRFRLRAQLSQQSLAERAGMSTAAIGVLERGVRRAPHRDTVALLATALALDDADQAILAAAADRGRPRAPRAAPRSADLPTYLTSFVGQDEAVRAIAGLLRETRCVTITGSGGVGKTRTAIEVARGFHDSGDEVAFADLSGVTDGRFVVSTIAEALHAPLAEQSASIDRLAASVRDRAVLLVIDNCEHLIVPAAAAVAALLRICPKMRILATSRERLAVTAETVYRLASLAVPHAVALFVERARRRDTTFALTPDRVPIVLDVCERLGGLPLAIELAATRVGTMGLKALRENLVERLAAAQSMRDLPYRQKTMAAAVAWSYDLLATAEQAVFARLAVFAGTFSSNAAAAVCGFGNIGAHEVDDHLASLVAKSLVDVIESDGEVRYRLLESVRFYASERLQEAGDERTVRRRHAEWLDAFVESVRAEGALALKKSWNAVVFPEFDNVRAALDWALGSDDAQDGLLAARIIGQLRSMWVQSGRRAELQRWTVAALERVDEEREPVVAGRLYWALMYATTGTSTLEAAERAIVLFERAGERKNTVWIHGQLGWEYCRRGLMTEADRAIAEAFRGARDNGDTGSVLYAGLLRIAAWIASAAERIAEAREHADEAARLLDALDDDVARLQLLNCRAEIEFVAGEHELAIALCTEALARAAQVPGALRQLVGALNDRCAYQVASGALDAAIADGCEAIDRAGERYPTLVPWVVQHLGAVIAVRENAPNAARLLGFADAWVAGNGFARHGGERATHRVLLAALEKRLPAPARLALAREGAGYTFEAAAQLALGVRSGAQS